MLGDYFANDYAIGNLIHKAGYTVVLSHHIIDHVVNQTFQKMWNNQLRWATSTRYSRPKGHFGSGLIFAMPFGLLGFLSAALMGNVELGLWLFIVACVNRAGVEVREHRRGSGASLLHARGDADPAVAGAGEEHAGRRLCEFGFDARQADEPTAQRLARPTTAADVTETLMRMVAAPNLAAKTWITSQYDRYVMGKIGRAHV